MFMRMKFAGLMTAFVAATPFVAVGNETEAQQQANKKNLQAPKNVPNKVAPLPKNNPAQGNQVRIVPGVPNNIAARQFQGAQQVMPFQGAVPGSQLHGGDQGDQQNSEQGQNGQADGGQGNQQNGNNGGQIIVLRAN